MHTVLHDLLASCSEERYAAGMMLRFAAARRNLRLFKHSRFWKAPAGRIIVVKLKRHVDALSNANMVYDSYFSA